MSKISLYRVEMEPSFSSERNFSTNICSLEFISRLAPSSSKAMSKQYSSCSMSSLL